MTEPRREQALTGTTTAQPQGCHAPQGNHQARPAARQKGEGTAGIERVPECPWGKALQENKGKVRNR